MQTTKYNVQDQQTALPKCNAKKNLSAFLQQISQLGLACQRHLLHHSLAVLLTIPRHHTCTGWSKNEATMFDCQHFQNALINMRDMRFHILKHLVYLNISVKSTG